MFGLNFNNKIGLTLPNPLKKIKPSLAKVKDKFGIFWMTTFYTQKTDASWESMLTFGSSWSAGIIELNT